ncbi:MAG TPA: tetratricopeptide repeat protein [Bacteroidales bacterium]|nr:tetratricopeptide repeat protein [Bacteroidales bacterium]
MKIKIFIFAFLLSIISVAKDFNHANILLDSANNAYVKKDYEKAITFYQNILKEGFVAPEIYYNIGNSYFKLNQITNAIYFYEKALLLSPNDKDIKYNLEIAKQYTTDKIKSIEPFFLNKFYHNLITFFSVDQWAMISLVSFISVLILLFLFLFSKNIIIKKIFFWFSVILFILSAGSIGFALSEKKKITTHNTAIIFSPTVNIKSSPDEQGTNLMIIHEGIKVIIVDSLQNWYNIILPDGNEGWLKKDDIKKI